jgi:hypothetical protein
MTSTQREREPVVRRRSVTRTVAVVTATAATASAMTTATAAAAGLMTTTMAF